MLHRTLTLVLREEPQQPENNARMTATDGPYSKSNHSISHLSSNPHRQSLVSQVLQGDYRVNLGLGGKSSGSDWRIGKSSKGFWSGPFRMPKPKKPTDHLFNPGGEFRDLDRTRPILTSRLPDGHLSALRTPDSAAKPAPEQRRGAASEREQKAAVDPLRLRRRAVLQGLDSQKAAGILHLTTFFCARC